METKPKILFILHLPPPIHGAAMVGKWIHDSEKINEKFDCRYINLTVAASLADIGQVGFRKVMMFSKLMNRIRRTVKVFKPDLVYITPNAAGGAFYKDFMVVNMVKRMGCRVLCHYHNTGVQRRQMHTFDDQLYRSFFKDIKLLLIVPQLYDDVKRYIRIRDIYFCPNGVPRIVDEEVSAERNNKVPEILFLSNLLLSKGILDLLDALYILRGNGYEFHCTIVGAEAAMMNGEKLQREIESRHLSGMVDYAGAKYGVDKDYYLRNADIFVFPSHREAFGLVNLEAMQYKLPIVATNIGGIPYTVHDGETGYICPVRNPIHLSQALTKLIENPELRITMGNAGYQFFNKEFTMEKFIDRMIIVLSRVLEEMPTRKPKMIY